MSDASSAESPAPRGRLLSAGFVGLLLTQLLTAVNDNIFRWLVIGIGKDYVSSRHITTILILGTACFVLPYILLAAIAGYLADRYPKRSVIIACKVAEIAIMLLGILAIWLQSVVFLFVVVALMGAQSALFSPSKLGTIPEILRSNRISKANGLFGLVTVNATIIGMWLGGWLSDNTGEKGLTRLWLSALVVVGIALAGWLLSLLIPKRPAAAPQRHFPWNAPAQTWLDLKVLASNRAMLRVALGMVFFWSLGALAQLNIDQFSAESGGTAESDRTPMLVCLVLGVGLGSVLAGLWSAGAVELGILPLGAFGMALSSFLLWQVQPTLFDHQATITAGMVWACVLLSLLGISAGLFDVPLEAYMQHRSPPHQRGSILAAANLLTFLGVLVFVGLFWALRAPVRTGSPDRIDQALIDQPLDESSQQQIDALLPTDQPLGPAALGAVVEQLPADQQAAGLVPLAWHDFQLIRAAGGAVELEDYLDACGVAYGPLLQAVFLQSDKVPLCSSREIFLLFGIGTIPVMLYIVFLIPQAAVRFIVWLCSLTIYRIRVLGRQHLPERGGALLVSNHVSFIDGILLLMISSRPVRMIVWSGNFQQKWLKWLADIWGAIMINPKRPKEIVTALKTAREALRNGELVCIFPEGGITRTAQLQAFRPGLLKIVKGTDAPVIPVYMDELWGSIFSFSGGKFFWKWPARWPYTISIHFGPPLESPDDIYQVRSAIAELGSQAVIARRYRMKLVPQAFLKACRRRLFQTKVADSTGVELSGGQLMLRSLIARRLLRKNVLDPQETYVGVLLPPTVPGVVINAALTLDRRVPVNLNYTVSSAVMNQCLAQANIRHVLTSRKVMENLDLELDAEVVYLEDLRDLVSTGDKVSSACLTYGLPAGITGRILGLQKIQPDDIQTVIFTSGSTGIPKGVLLTYANIASNVSAIEQVIHLSKTDVVVGILPFFHSFGYTVTLWTALAQNVKGTYHYNPLDAKRVGKLCKKYGGTILCSTPTFLRGFVRRCKHDELCSLDVVVTGAEKLPKPLADAFEDKFGVRPVEGYGTTELSPLVSVNIPPTRALSDQQLFAREGSVGRPVPGVSVRVVQLETGEVLGTNEPGMLQVQGPNVMSGYMGRQDLTDDVIRDGWYITGDVAKVDEDGFVIITGRESRFSKIGGEMVPHIEIEEHLLSLLHAEENDLPPLAVTAVPDERKGERLIVVHTELSVAPADLRQQLIDAGLPPLYIPSTDSFLQVAELPVLGTGKLDLKAVQQMAKEHFVSG